MLVISKLVMVCLWKVIPKILWAKIQLCLDVEPSYVLPLKRELLVYYNFICDMFIFV